MSVTLEEDGVVPLVGTEVINETPRINPIDLSNSRKRLPSESPQHDSSDNSRSGQRKYLKENENMECDNNVNRLLDNELSASDQGKTNSSNDNLEASTNFPDGCSNFDSKSEHDKSASMDFECLYDHCATEKSLLSQLNKMSELLRSSTIETPEMRKSLILTPMVKSLFHSPGKSAPAETSDNPINTSLEGRTQLDMSKFDDNNKYYPVENNLFLRAIASSIDNMQGLLKSNTESVNSLAFRVSAVESSTERSLSDLSERLIETENACIQNKGGINEVYRYVDEKVSVLKDAIPETVAEVSREVDTRLDSHENEIKKAQTSISLLPTHETIAERFEKVLSNKIAKLEETSNFRISAIENRMDRLEANVPLDKPVTKDDLNDVILRLSKLETDMRTELDKIKSGKPNESGQVDDLFQDVRTINNSRSDWSSQKTKLNEFESRIEGLEHEFSSYKKTTDFLSIQIRKENIIIDQLQEVDNENILARLNTIFDVTLIPADRNEVQIKRAFRLGTKRADGPPRKILLELKSGREIVFEKARIITKSGNDGKPYYINDDVPESVKRRRSDIHKYVLYLRERGHQAEKAGEDVIINNQRWKYGDLNNLPIGDRLMDSRTISQYGSVAFQSSVSPLSNLFPCNIRMNGMPFKSAEQCYQYAKAMHHNMLQKANEIRREPDSYINMSQGGFTEDPSWRERKFGIMESILRHKIEQVPVFREMLRQTNNHKLVENSWSFVWGTACPFRAPCVWDGSYRGHNHLGRLLEKVRDSSW